VTVESLLDCEGSFATVHEVFPAVDSDERWVLPINCVLVRNADTTVLIDTGVGPKPRTFILEPDARLLDGLARHGVAPDEVDLVVHTHPLANVERIGGETELVPGVRSLPTLGHTPGHMSARAGAVVSDHDTDRAAATRRRFLGELADEGVDVIVSHFYGTGRLERSGKGFRWAVE